MTRDNAYFLLLNLGHFLDHYLTLVFATVAALVLWREWDVGYDALLLYATPGFFAFGVFALPAGWLADKWSRDGMMVIFFVGIGLASIATSFAATPLQMAVGLFAVGVFAAIYHPVGLAILVSRWKNVGMRIAMNGVWGNLGVASAALVTGWLIDSSGWRAAFVLPGVVSVAAGIAYLALRREAIGEDRRPKAPAPAPAVGAVHRGLVVRVTAVAFLTTAVGSLIFQSTSFALPKIFDERMGGLAEWIAGSTALPGETASVIGSLVFIVFAVASVAQLIVGATLDRYGPRAIYMTVACLSLVCFAAMPGLTDLAALAVALGFMLGTFGQVPINDFMIGKVAHGPARARIYGARYVVGFSVFAAALPFVSFVYDTWGFDRLFVILAVSAAVILAAVATLPGRLPAPAPLPAPAE
ncbi:MFS transporter [Acuticoccus sp.]|uniref:MFS transporter n=1 Tax=Acuticoccus sp. TaxID=1904378 RepID=UPI003B51C9C2